MRFLWIIRFFTVAIALLYGVHNAPWDEIAMFFDHSLSIISEGGHSVIVSAGTVGLYITAIASVALAFFGIPRWRSGTRVLSWCFLLMGISLLTRLIPAYWDRLLPWHIQVTSYTVPLIWALPPFILAAVLRQPSIQALLQHPR